MKRKIYLCLLCLLCAPLTAQVYHSIRGKVIDKNTRLPIEFANVALVGKQQGASTDSLGQFAIERIQPDIYRLEVSYVGYQTLLTPDYVLGAKDLYVTLELEESAQELTGVVVTTNSIRRHAEAPLGMKIIGLREIEKSPGANRDISRIVQAYPGVSFSPVGYRNDLIVRGGGPAENRFYLDEIEIPNINHFSTQGASGGPVGIINADLIREVKFHSGVMPIDKGNALSAVLDFKLREGDLKTRSNKATLGASEVSLSGNGYLGSQTTYLYSVRRSYLQFLFDWLGLPLLPTFTDATFKVKTKLNSRNELTILGLAGIDDMKLNTKLKGEDAAYILSYLPVIQQETFTLGATYRHYARHGQQTYTLSHSYLHNRNVKYTNNDDSNEENLRLRLGSTERETKFRFKHAVSVRQWKLSGGVNLDYVHYDNHTYQKNYTSSLQLYDYRTDLQLLRYGAFMSGVYESPQQGFTLSLGVRTDASNFSSGTDKPWKQLAPQLSTSVKLSKHLFLSASSGWSYQLPSYLSLGFKNVQNEWMNKGLRYMQLWQNSIGVTWREESRLELSAETFYKRYRHVPLSLTDGIPLTCKGNDYGFVGNEPLAPLAVGRSYGMEFYLKWHQGQRMTLTGSLTLFRSEYQGTENHYVNSTWDNRMIFYVSSLYNLPKHWSIGLKVNAIGGAPYTPYDEDKSSLVEAWNAQGRPYADTDRYNAERLSTYAQLDVRVDKTFYLKRAMLGFYLDLQNLTHSTLKEQDVLMSTGIISNPDAAPNEQRYEMKRIKQESGTLLPTLGITLQW